MVRKHEEEIFSEVLTLGKRVSPVNLQLNS